MRITLNRTLRVGNATMRRGATVTMGEAKAKQLLERGLAAEFREPKPKPEPKPKAD